MDPELLQLIQMARTGNRQAALFHLRNYLLEHLEDADAWVVLGGLTPDPEEGVRALQRALQLNPNNEMARRGLAARQATLPVTQPVETVPLVPVEPEPASVSEPVIEAEPVVEPAAVDVPAGELPEVEADEFEVEDEGEAEEGEDDEDEDFSEPESVESRAARDEGPSEGMTLRQAMNISWPFRPRGSQRRTLGDFIDAGLLTRQDLEWTAKHAREPRVRIASQVILGQIHRLPLVMLTEGEARLISWPFRRMNRPLGELVDTGLITAKDLRWAAWFADEPRLREAARLMLPQAHKERAKKPAPASPKSGGGNRKPAETHTTAKGGHTPKALSQPAAAGTSAGRALSNRPMPMIQGSDYLTRQIERRHRRQIFIQVLALALVVIAAVIVVVVGFSSLSGVLHISPAVAFLGLLLLVPLYWLFDRLQDAIQEEESFRQGREAERSVARLLRQGLNDQWTLFMNVQIPGQQSDIDMVLLGPPGIFTLEVKSYRGRFALRGTQWQRKTMMGWQVQRRNPALQARFNASQLHEYIREHLKKDIWVDPRLVWAGEGRLDLHQPAVFVWSLDRLPEETKRLRTLPAQVTPEDQAAVGALLRGLCSALQ